MSDQETTFNPQFAPPKMVKITVGDKSFETFITGHDIDQGALGRYSVNITLLAQNDDELLVVEDVLRDALWPEPIERFGSRAPFKMKSAMVKEGERSGGIPSAPERSIPWGKITQ